MFSSECRKMDPRIRRTRQMLQDALKLSLIHISRIDAGWIADRWRRREVPEASRRIFLSLIHIFFLVELFFEDFVSGGERRGAFKGVRARLFEQALFGAE